jgi:hypothetical protein
MRTLLTALMVFFMALAACAPITKQEKQEIAKPVNCATAEGDLRMLRSEKASVEKMIADGVTAVVPVGAIIGIVTLTEGDKLKVATGEYNKAIDKKIQEIKTQCNCQ